MLSWTFFAWQRPNVWYVPLHKTLYWTDNMIDSFQMKIRLICLYVLVWIAILDMYSTSVRQTLLRLISSYVLVSRNGRSVNGAIDGIALYFVLYGIGSPWVDSIEMIFAGLLSSAVMASLAHPFRLFHKLSLMHLSLIHIWRCRRSTLCRSRWSPYH